MRSLILLSFIACLGAADQAPPLPHDAQAVLDQLDKDVAKLHEKAAADLAKVQATETKAGHLEAALAIKGEVAKLTPAKTDAPKKAAAVDYKAMVIGTWDMSVANGYRSALMLTDKGKATVRDNTGTFRVDDAGMLTLSWNNGRTDKVTLSPDGTHGEGTGPDGAMTIVKNK